MAKYRKKPVVIEAEQFDPKKWHPAVISWDSEPARPRDMSFGYIKTLEGNMHVNSGDYIIKGVKGEFYPCKPGIFEMTYELVAD